MAVNSTTGLLSDPTKINAPVIAPVVPIATSAPIATATSNGALSTAQTRAVNGNELLSNNVNNLIDANSPLMQQAATRAKQQANGSGLLNSSMAVGAAQGAVMDKAITIGQGDAATYTNNLDRNLANQQSSNVLNTSNELQNNQFNAQNSNAVNEFNTSTANDIKKYNSTSVNEVNKTNAQLGLAAEQSNLTAQTEVNKANLDTKTKLDMADIEANYKTLMQADASLGTMYTQMIKNITDISSNKDMTATAKQAATDLQTNSFKTYANMTAAMNNLNISALLNFGAK